MRSHYNIILWDGSYFLYRNQSIGRGKLSVNGLAKSLIQSLVKLVRDSPYTFDTAFLCFDKKPYWRTRQLGGKYKDSRECYTDEDIINERKHVDTLIGEERNKAEKWLAHMIQSKHDLDVRTEAIKLLKKALPTCGIQVLLYPGYEADDLARIVRELYSDKYSILLMSIDSDWLGMVSHNVDFLRCRHHNIFDFYDTETIKSSPDYIEMKDEGLEEMGIKWYLEIKEAMGVGHNDMRNCVTDPITIGEIVANWDDLDRLKDLYNFDSDTFKRQINTFDFKKFPDYDKISYNISSIKYDIVSPQNFNLYQYGIGINFHYYKSLYDRICNYRLLQVI
jgi:hypothetical protein